MKRMALCFFLGMAAISAPGLSAAAENYPDRPVTIIVPFPPGGATDQLARRLGQSLSDALGQTFVVENRAGAGGRVGSRLAARARPDGYTLLMGTNASHAIAAALYKNLPYDSLRDFAPVTIMAKIPMVLMTHSATGIKNLRDVEQYSREHPGSLSFGTGGNGTPGHLGLELLKIVADIDMLHVPFQGGSPAVMALAGGQVELAVDDVSSSLSQIKAGTVVPVAVTSAQRSSALPDTPTIAEQGVDGVEFGSWFALFAPAGTPEAIVETLNRETAKALATEKVRNVLQTYGAEPAAGTPDELRGLISDDIDKWKKVVDRIGLQLD